MISANPSRLGKNERLADRSVAHRHEISLRRVFEIKFNGFAEIGDRFIARGAEARNIRIQALRDEIVVFAINAVSHRFHGVKLSFGVGRGNECGPEADAAAK